MPRGLTPVKTSVVWSGIVRLKRLNSPISRIRRGWRPSRIGRSRGSSPFLCQSLGQHSRQRVERLPYFSNVAGKCIKTHIHAIKSALKARMPRKHLGSQGANIRLDRGGFLVIEPGKSPDLNRKEPLKICDPLFTRLFGHGILLETERIGWPLIYTCPTWLSNISRMICRKQVSCPGYVAHELSGFMAPP